MVLCRRKIEDSGEERSEDQCGPISEINFLNLGSVNQANHFHRNGREGREEQKWYLVMGIFTSFSKGLAFSCATAGKLAAKYQLPSTVPSTSVAVNDYSITPWRKA